MESGKNNLNSTADDTFDGDASAPLSSIGLTLTSDEAFDKLFEKSKPKNFSAMSDYQSNGVINEEYFNGKKAPLNYTLLRAVQMKNCLHALNTKKPSILACFFSCASPDRAVTEAQEKFLQHFIAYFELASRAEVVNNFSIEKYCFEQARVAMKKMEKNAFNLVRNKQSCNRQSQEFSKFIQCLEDDKDPENESLLSGVEMSNKIQGLY